MTAVVWLLIGYGLHEVFSVAKYFLVTRPLHAKWDREAAERKEEREQWQAKFGGSERGPRAVKS